jgi:hypothetical protein
MQLFSINGIWRCKTLSHDTFRTTIEILIKYQNSNLTLHKKKLSNLFPGYLDKKSVRGLFKYEYSWINFQECLTKCSKIMILVPPNTHHQVVYNVLVFKSNLKCGLIIVSSYTGQTLENSRTEIFFPFAIFFQQGVLWASDIGKSHYGQYMANEEGKETRQPVPVLDILVQWPLCLTKHCHATTLQHGDQLLVDVLF